MEQHQEPTNRPGVPSPAQQQWGALISMIVIVLMVIVGAFYAWNKRVAEQRAFQNAGAAVGAASDTMTVATTTNP